MENLKSKKHFLILLPHTQKLGQFLKAELSKLTGISHVRGKGLMLGIQLDIPAKDLHQALLKKGVICGVSREPNTLRILPPLTLNQIETGFFLQSIQSCLTDLCSPGSFQSPLPKENIPCNTTHP